jgi:uncharacterized protein (TIGR02145 family)
MKTINYLLLLVVLILFSCETPERNNPYDPECPKSIWTPTSFQASVEGNSIKLTWNGPSLNYAGFRITKRVNNGNVINLGEFPKNVFQFTDTNIIDGEINVYTIYAYAGNNQSNSLITQATLILPAAFLPSVTICNQIWQNSNLDVTTYRDGTPIPQVTDPLLWSNLTTGAWCYYENNSANGTIYGKLYNWYAIMGVHDNNPSTPNKILAPQGWHVSTNNDWSLLTNSCLQNAQIAGGPLKSVGTTYWNSPNLGATNSTGFSALPAGSRNGNNGSFNYKGVFADFWASFNTPVDRILSYNYNWVSGLGPTNRDGLSVRCVKD